MQKSSAALGRRLGAAALAVAFIGAVLPILPVANAAAAATTAEAAPAAETVTPPEAAVSAPATALERARASGRIRLGYVDGARPFSYRDSSGNPAGYAVDLCRQIAEAAKSELAMPSLEVEWVAQAWDQRFAGLQTGGVDVECAAGVVTLADRARASFSIPIFPGSVGALLRRDASWRLQQLLEEGPPRFQPFWRASPTQLLGEQTFAAIPGGAGESFVKTRASALKLTSTLVPVADLAAGVQSVVDRKADVFFADRALLLDASRSSPAAHDLVVLHREFTLEPIALGVARGDEDMRLLVDRTLSRMYRSGELHKVYAASFGEADESTLNYFKASVLPE